MDLDEAPSFLREDHHAVLHTYRRDGSPQLSPVAVTVDDLGHAIVSTRETSIKVTNLERDPRASLCVFPDAFFGPWIRIDGTTEIVHLPETLEPSVVHHAVPPQWAVGHHEWDAPATCAGPGGCHVRWQPLTGRRWSWRRWTGIEPARGASRLSPVLKTGGPTREPDTSEHLRARVAP